MSFLDYDLLGPVDQGGVGILNADGHNRGEDVQGLPHDEACLHGMGLQRLWNSHYGGRRGVGGRGRYMGEGQGHGGGAGT